MADEVRECHSRDQWGAKRVIEIRVGAGWGRGIPASDTREPNAQNGRSRQPRSFGPGMRWCGVQGITGPAILSQQDDKKAGDDRKESRDGGRARQDDGGALLAEGEAILWPV